MGAFWAAPLRGPSRSPGYQLEQRGMAAAANYTLGMDLRQLEYFVRVAELGSFTRAT